MILYVDTSALVKRYLEEEGSRYLRSLFDDCDVLVTSLLTKLEFISTVERAKRAARINSPTYRTITATFEKDTRVGAISFIQIATHIIDVAARITRARRLKPPDAIQLASALEAQPLRHSSYHFLCTDQALNEAARLEGLRCIDVVREEVPSRT